VGRIQTTPIVKVALFSLRVYLIILLTLIVMKFYRVLSASQEAKSSVNHSSAVQPGQYGVGTNAVPLQTP
jgi:hypothetical protein